MKKTVKAIIGLSAALVVLGGGLAVLKLTAPKEEEDSSSSSSSDSVAGETVLEDKEISSIDVKNLTGEFTVTEKEKASGDEAATYTLKGYESLPLDTALVGTLANNVRGMESSAVVSESADELGKYGLEKPQITAQLHYSDGDEATLYIGDNAPNGSETYVKTSESDTVYTVSVSKVANYSRTVNEFVSSTILAEPGEDEYPKINSVVIDRKDLDYDIKLEYNDIIDKEGYNGGVSSIFRITEPISYYVSDERASDITNGMFGLKSESVYRILPEGSDIAETGLDDPFCTVTMSCDDGNEYVLRMSEVFTDDEENKSYYVMLNDVDVIYTVAAEDARWGEIQLIDISSTYVNTSYVWDITSMEIGGRDIETKKIDIIKKEDADDDNLKSEDFTVKLNGKTVDPEHYRQYYSILLDTTADEFAIDEKIPDSEPILYVEYYDSFREETVRVEYYDYSNMKTLIVINGQSMFLSVKSFAEVMAENSGKIETGEEYEETWK